jgi:hypothetical protein
MKKLAILFFGVFILSTSAQAVIYDFGAEGDRLEMGYESYTTGLGNPMPVGLKMAATANKEQAFIYMDSAVGTKDGGMGVCKFLNIDGQCKPSTDDNMVFGETVTIGTVDDSLITHIKIRGDHEPVNKGVSLLYTIDGGDFELDISGRNGLLWIALDSASSFINYTIRGEGGEMYLSALATDMVVPVPAAVWLFGTALVGFIGVSRRRKVA